MNLAKLIIKNFRKLKHADLSFQPGLNVLVGGVAGDLKARLFGGEVPFFMEACSCAPVVKR